MALLDAWVLQISTTLGASLQGLQIQGVTSVGSRIRNRKDLTGAFDWRSEYLRQGDPYKPTVGMIVVDDDVCRINRVLKICCVGHDSWRTISGPMVMERQRNHHSISRLVQRFKAHGALTLEKGSKYRYSTDKICDDVARQKSSCREQCGKPIHVLG